MNETDLAQNGGGLVPTIIVNSLPKFPLLWRTGTTLKGRLAAVNARIKASRCGPGVSVICSPTATDQPEKNFVFKPPAESALSISFLKTVDSGSAPTNDVQTSNDCPSRLSFSFSCCSTVNLRQAAAPLSFAASTSKRAARSFAVAAAALAMAAFSSAFAAPSFASAMRSFERERIISQCSSFTVPVQTIMTVAIAPAIRLPMRSKLARSNHHDADSREGHGSLSAWFAISAIAIIKSTGSAGLALVVRANLRKERARRSNMFQSH